MSKIDEMVGYEIDKRISWLEMELLFSSKPIDLIKESSLEEFPREDELFDEIIQILVD